MDTKKTQFQQTCRKFRQKPEIFSPEYTRVKKNSFQKNSPQNFSMDAEKAVLTTLLKPLCKKPTVFRSLSASDKKFSSKPFFQQSFLFGQVEQFFDETFGIFSTNCRKNFVNWPTRIRNHISSSGNIFPHSVPVDMQNVLLKTPTTFSTSRQKIVTQKPKKRRKILILKENRSL